MIRTILLLTLVVCCITAYSQIGKLEPFDESEKDKSLVEFIEQLKEAVKTRNKAFIKGAIAKESYIPLEGGETTTAEQFYNFYFNQPDKGYNFWKNLEYILEISGGGFKYSPNGEVEYHMPYTSANLQDSEPFTSLGSYVIALSDTTPVFHKPSSYGIILELLDYEIIPVNIQTYVPHWVEVELNTGETGYVRSKDVIYTIDVRAGFILENGRWKIKFADGFE